jgi:hypothetical protein
MELQKQRWGRISHIQDRHTCLAHGVLFFTAMSAPLSIPFDLHGVKDTKTHYIERIVGDREI